jgi:hypothetical protein
VVESDNYDDYVKLKKDLEKLSITNTIVTGNLNNDHDMALENEMLREENKRLKLEKDLRSYQLMMNLEKRTRNSS